LSEGKNPTKKEFHKNHNPTMTTYVYETIPTKKGQEPKLYEIQQSMKDEPLAKHPETGEPIRRVILGGYGLMKSAENTSSTAPSASSCGPGCGCH